jgi:pyridoxine 4-dehydrogenase
MTEQNTTPHASVAGTFALGGDLEVNRLGFGAMRITGEGIWGGPENPEEAERVLRRCVELGVNLIDTADSYGPDVSERLIGETLAPYPEDVVIATKAGLVRPGPGDWRPNGRPEHIREAIEGSLRRLKLETIDLYQLHRIDPDVPAEESLGAMSELRDEGKVRHVGLSEVGVQDLRPTGSPLSPGSRSPQAPSRGPAARWTRSPQTTTPPRGRSPSPGSSAARR